MDEIIDNILQKYAVEFDDLDSKNTENLSYKPINTFTNVKSRQENEPQSNNLEDMVDLTSDQELNPEVLDNISNSSSNSSDEEEDRIKRLKVEQTTAKVKKTKAKPKLQIEKENEKLMKNALHLIDKNKKPEECLKVLIKTQKSNSNYFLLIFFFS